MVAINKKDENKIIGYSALSRKTHKYISIDGATYVANSGHDMVKFLEDSLLKSTEYMIDKESVVDLLHDYGDTHGSYALEIEALNSFKTIADRSKIKYNSNPYESFDSEEPELFIVEIEE